MDKLSFRKPSNFFEPEEKTDVKKEDVKPENEPKPEEKVNLENEPMKMYFYYPKYLQPEAVALIAQNLLSEWEKE